MVQKVFIGILIAYLSVNCQSKKTVEKINEEVHTHQIDSIAEMIDAFEYLKRENYGTWISKERIEHLKDSINYDSIVLQRALKNQIK